MTRAALIAVLVIAGLAVPARAQAQASTRSADERFAQPGGTPAFVSKIRDWIGKPIGKSAAQNAQARAARPVAPRPASTSSSPGPAPARVAARAPEPAPASAAPRLREPVLPKPRPFAAEPAATPQPRAVTAPMRLPKPRPAVAAEPAPEPFAARWPAPTTSGATAPAPAPVPDSVPTLRSAAAGGYRLASLTPPGRPGDCAGQRVKATYYWQGTRTASGARFDPDGLTAAHRTLPFGTRLTVVNPRNGKSVDVTINDRGPFVRGISLDLSRGAARAIGMAGTGAVCIL